MEVGDRDGLYRADLLALHAADAGVRVLLAGDSALLGIVAGDDRLAFAQGDHLDKSLGARFDAGPAGEAAHGMPVRDVVFCRYCDLSLRKLQLIRLFTDLWDLNQRDKLAVCPADDSKDER